MSNVTTQITLVAPFGGATNVSALVNKSGGLGAGLSYTASTGVVGTPVTATGATQLGTFKLFSGPQGQFQSAALVETFALQGVVIPPVGGAAFSAQFTKGVIAIFALPLLSFSPQKVATWGPTTAGSRFLYSATLQVPRQDTLMGPNGDPVFVGQPHTGQNQAHFFPSTGVSSVGAFAITTLSNPGTLFTTPQPFSGFQDEIIEVNALIGGGTINPLNYSSLTGFPTNADLDVNFSALGALDPGLGLILSEFANLNYFGNANANGPSVLQQIGVIQYPF
jgi:hypothetical protein